MASPSTGARANQRALQESIKRLIVDRNLTAGSPMPTERELVEDLAVSRHPLREAMKALEAQGIVDIRHGYGTFVGSASLSGLEAGLTFHSTLSARGDLNAIRDLLDVRQVLETGLAPRVLALHDRLDVPGLTAAVEAMEAAAAEGRYEPAADWRFHETLYLPLGNTLVLDLLRVFWRAFHAVEDNLEREKSTPAVTASRHRAILEAVLRRGRGRPRDRDRRALPRHPRPGERRRQQRLRRQLSMALRACDWSSGAEPGLRGQHPAVDEPVDGAHHLVEVRRTLGGRGRFRVPIQLQARGRGP